MLKDSMLPSLHPFTIALVLFAAGALMALGFAPFDAWPVIFISLPIFYWGLVPSQQSSSQSPIPNPQSPSLRQSLGRGFMFGYGYFMAGTWWIGNALLVDAEQFGWLLPFSVLGLSAVMALWFMVLGGLVYALRGVMSPLLFALLWVLVEYARTVGMFGFPWNLLGYMSLASLPLAQAASLVGVYGLSFLLLLLGLLPVVWWGQGRRIYKWLVTACVMVLVAKSMLYAMDKLHLSSLKTPTLLRVVQPNVPQAVKGKREGRAVALTALGELTTQPAEPMPDVVIWPETAYPFSVRVGEEHPLPKLPLLLTGAIRAEGMGSEGKVWNSLVAMDGQGRVLASYDKHQLVPFGEFVPLRSVLPIEKIAAGNFDFSRGDGAKTLRVAGVPPFSPLVCYEAVFPWLAVDKADRPAWLLNVTNDAWYGDSPGPYQHFAMTRMRAIEQGLPLVRAANSGISAVVDGYGRVVRALPLGTRGAMDVRLPAALPSTVYARYGEVWLFFSIMVAVVGILWRRVK